MRAKISNVQFEPVKPNDKGHLGFVSFTLHGQMRHQEVAVFSRLDGGIRLSFAEKDFGNTKKKTAYPINEETRIAIETQILEALKKEGKFNAENHNHNSMPGHGTSHS